MMSPLLFILMLVAAITDAYFTLGIDCGTQGLKALVYDTAATGPVGVGSVSYGLNSPAPPGRAEQDPEVWMDALY